MAIIYTYPKLTNLQNQDLLLISDASSRRKDTMRVELGDLANFIITSTGAITGGGTENYVPIFDATGTGIVDSQLQQSPPNGIGLYQMRFNNADRFIINKPSSATQGDPEYLIQQDGNYKVSFGWDDDGGGFGFIYNWAGNGLRLGAAGQNPQFELDTNFPKIISHTAHEFEGQVLDINAAGGSPGQVLSSTGSGVEWIFNTGSGTGTTNTLPIWVDGPTGVLGDSIIDQDYTNPETGVRINGDLQINEPGTGPLYTPDIIFTANNNGTPPLGVIQFRSDGVGFITSQGSSTGSGSLTMELGYDATRDFVVNRIAPGAGSPGVDMLRINPAGDTEITRSLKITPSSSTTTQEYVSAFNAFQVNKPTPGSTDTVRTGVVHIGKGSTGTFTEFDHTLNLYTPSSFSDPTNFSDAKAFRYTWNDAYTFAKIEAQDYAGGIISPQWSVGDHDGETTGAIWQVNNGDHARFITPGSDPYFEVTPNDAQFNVPVIGTTVIINGLINNLASAATGGYDFMEFVSNVTSPTQIPVMRLTNDMRLVGFSFVWMGDTALSIGAGEQVEFTIGTIPNGSNPIIGNYTSAGTLFTLDSSYNGTWADGGNSGLTIAFNKGDIIAVVGQETGTVTPNTGELGITLEFIRK